ncbi:hypothetical protein L3556_13895 [Candidatus Synechococcus calcipolaris G9]|uniref:Uncharacterized protein n=1 Tax=Candidatus Synechococcus calcipolaris G9 TaxID=1497997 RepID=A0ABT6F2D0_9SYNE|nr:hypothetical protein [Candidatus Synechococcus calcipolaris]MDG2992013.1 hypothetical protein [Candidatus Synechococcus calcipolaris G9]
MVCIHDRMGDDGMGSFGGMAWGGPVCVPESDGESGWRCQGVMEWWPMGGIRNP